MWLLSITQVSQVIIVETSKPCTKIVKIFVKYFCWKISVVAALLLGCRCCALIGMSLLRSTSYAAGELVMLCLTFSCSLCGMSSLRLTSCAAGGLATLCVPFPLPLAAGPLQSIDYQELRDLWSLFRFRPMPYKSKLLTVLSRNEISIAFAMLTPDNQCFAVRGGFEPPVR